MLWSNKCAAVLVHFVLMFQEIIIICGLGAKAWGTHFQNSRQAALQFDLACAYHSTMYILFPSSPPLGALPNYESWLLSYLYNRTRCCPMVLLLSQLLSVLQFLPSTIRISKFAFLVIPWYVARQERTLHHAGPWKDLSNGDSEDLRSNGTALSSEQWLFYAWQKWPSGSTAATAPYRSPGESLKGVHIVPCTCVIDPDLVCASSVKDSQAAEYSQPFPVLRTCQDRVPRAGRTL